jgi:hypothetical protein
MNPEVIGVFVPIFLFGAIAAVLLTYYDGRHKERMAMIEKGVNPAEFNSTTPSVNPLRFLQSNVISNLKWGLLFIFIGAGWLVGEQLQYYFGFHEESAIFGTILIAGGLALIIFYFIATKKMKNQQIDQR